MSAAAAAAAGMTGARAVRPSSARGVLRSHPSRVPALGTSTLLILTHPSTPHPIAGDVRRGQGPPRAQPVRPVGRAAKRVRASGRRRRRAPGPADLGRRRQSRQRDTSHRASVQDGSRVDAVVARADDRGVEDGDDGRRAREDDARVRVGRVRADARVRGRRLRWRIEREVNIRRVAARGAFYTLVPIRPRRRGERHSLWTFPGASLRPGSLALNPRYRRLSTPTDAYELHPDVASYGTTLRRRGCVRPRPLPVRELRLSAARRNASSNLIAYHADRPHPPAARRALQIR